MRYLVPLAALFLTIVVVDSFANDSRLMRTAERNIVDNGRQPAQIADSALGFLMAR